MPDSSPLFLVLLLSVLIVSCIGFWVFFVVEPAQEQYRLSDEARSKNDFRLCERLAEPMERDFCLRDVGSSAGESSVCARIGSPSIGGECLRSLAISRRDPVVCDMIKDDAQMRGCISSFGVEYACYKANETETRDNCYTQAALETASPDLCEKAKNKTASDLCRQRLAAKLGQESLCQNIGDLRLRESCQQGIGRMKAQPLRPKMPASSYFSPAQAECEKTGLSSEKVMCYSSYARRLGNGVCDDIMDPDAKDRCFTGLATALNDSGVCNHITGGWSHGECVINLCQSEKNPAKCGWIVNDTQKMACMLCVIGNVSCSDSDGGFVLEKRGFTEGINLAPLPNYVQKHPYHFDQCLVRRSIPGGTIVESVARCDGPDCILDEGYCYGPYQASRYRDCPEGCQWGACTDDDITPVRLVDLLGDCSRNDSIYESRCLAEEAAYGSNPQKCETGKNSVISDKCYELTATLTGNSTVCSLIKQGWEVDACKEHAMRVSSRYFTTP